MNVLVIAAHCDDETIGCGGTIAKHVQSGDEVTVLILADGTGSRGEKPGGRDDMADEACDFLGVKRLVIGCFPDNEMDTVPLLSVVKEIESIVKEVRPQIIYTHFKDDMNIDHRITHEAVMTACRPLPLFPVKKILCFEVASSTEWRGSFTPNYFVDISDTLETKMNALLCYGDEIREYPHPRSHRAIHSLAHWRGATVGVLAAEAFVSMRVVA